MNGAVGMREDGPIDLQETLNGPVAVILVKPQTQSHQWEKGIGGDAADGSASP